MTRLTPTPEVTPAEADEFRAACLPLIEAIVAKRAKPPADPEAESELARVAERLSPYRVEATEKR